MDWKKMYPTTSYVVIQIVLLLLFLIPGILFFIWRLLVTK